MDWKYFLATVEKMRAKQREYFRSRDVMVLRESKKLELEVDRLIAAEKDTQGSLFK